jgi:hypothetical protein
VLLALNDTEKPKESNMKSPMVKNTITAEMVPLSVIDEKDLYKKNRKLEKQLKLHKQLIPNTQLVNVKPPKIKPKRIMVCTPDRASFASSSTLE